jgi:hypothetical protein
MSKPSNIVAAAAHFNELAAAHDAAPWQQLHPVIQATTQLLGDATAAWKPSIAAEVNSQQQQLTRAWLAAVVGGLTVVVFQTRQLPPAAPMPPCRLCRPWAWWSVA